MKTLAQAKKQVEELKAYISMVENFDVKTAEDHIIKAYAEFGSIVKVVNKMYKEKIEIDRKPIEAEDVTNGLKQRGQNDLHRLLRTWYFKKTRKSRSTW